MLDGCIEEHRKRIQLVNANKKLITNSGFGFCTSVYTALITTLQIGDTCEDVATRRCFSKNGQYHHQL